MITPINKVKHSITPFGLNKTPNSAYGIAVYGIGTYLDNQNISLENKAKNIITPNNKDKS